MTKLNDCKYIAIMASNLRGIVGDNGNLPWKSAQDLAYFRAFTNNKPIVMGRKTFESLGRKLPNRTHVVITRDRGYTHVPYSPDIVVTDLDEPFFLLDKRPLCLIGGAEILQSALDRDLVEYIHQTIVHEESAGDVMMPAIPEAFELLHSHHVPHYLPPLTFKVYQKLWEK